MRRLLLLVLLVAGAFAPATGASAQSPPPSAPVNTGLGIRLAEAPADRAKDPRALQYVIDHVAPGTVLRRRVQVTNDTGDATKVRLYGGGAAIEEGAFAPVDDGEVGRWITATPGELDLPEGGRAEVVATISVPAGASEGERYGVIWAELPPVSDASGISQVARVGVRVYLSVGPGGEPQSDFEIMSLTAGRSPEGAPVVSATVRNTGGRALDMTGDLRLENGPGGLAAGPFPAEVGTTLGVGQTAPVRIVMDERFPAGPWDARLSLRSGTTTREATATITFPDTPGETAGAVEATGVEKQKRVLLPIAVGLLALVIGAIALTALVQRNGRRKASSDVQS